MCFTTLFSWAQNNEKNQAALEKKINGLLDFSVNTIATEELDKYKDDFIILDSREREEFETSHILNARFIGYDNFDISSLEGIDKEARIVVYCSIGYRSEKIGKKLKKSGFKNVYNLYGSIFKWANEGRPIVNNSGEKTMKIHTYNKKWSKWVFAEDLEKVW